MKRSRWRSARRGWTRWWRLDLSEGNCTVTTGNLVSEEEYLHSSYEPDCEFEDGLLNRAKLRSMEHGELQALIAAYLPAPQGLEHRAATGTTLQDSRQEIFDSRYCRRSGRRETAGVITIPPLLWIEILSPDDRPVRVMTSGASASLWRPVRVDDRSRTRRKWSTLARRS